MKKIFASMFLLVFGLCLVGCESTLSNFVDGQYISTNEVDNELFSKIKLELYQIDDEKYLSSKGINVIHDISITEYDKYFSFELYLYLNEINEYVKINLTDFYPDKGSPQIYYAYTIKGEENYNIESITFMYNHKKIMISQNGIDYYYDIMKK